MFELLFQHHHCAIPNQKSYTLDYFLVSSLVAEDTYSAPSRKKEYRGFPINNKMSAYVIDPEWFVKFDQCNIVGKSATSVIVFMHYNFLSLTRLSSAIHLYLGHKLPHDCVF